MAHPAPALGRLLEDLRRTRLLVTPQELAHRLPAALPTGLPPLDRLLGGGLPEGRVVELGQARGAHASALALRMLAQTTSEGRTAAWVDRTDAFDPRGAGEAGADLERLLWCRPSSVKDAIRAADVLLSSGAFSLVVLDLAGPPGGKAPRRGPGRRGEAVGGAGSRSPRAAAPGADVHYEPYAPGPRRPRERRREAEISQGAWLRLARDAEAARTSLVVLGGEVAAGVAAVTLRVARCRARFAGRGPGRTFEGIELVVALERNRLGLPPGEASLSFRAPPHFPGPVREPAPGEARTAARVPGIDRGWDWPEVSSDRPGTPAEGPCASAAAAGARDVLAVARFGKAPGGSR